MAGGPAAVHAEATSGLRLITGKRAAAAKPLREHVEDYRADLKATNTADYADQTATRLQRVFDAAGMTYYSDITPARVRTAISRLRHAGKGLKKQTQNHYVTVVKSFANWMMADGRASSSPIDGKKLAKQKVTDATERRAGTLNELRRIIAAAEQGPEFRWGGGRGAKRQPRCVTGPERAVLYTLAAETGYRASELGSLKPTNFRLDALPYAVTVESGYTKKGKTATTPLSESTAAMLRAFLAHKHPQAHVFDIPGDEERNEGQTARMIRRDCEAAGVDYVDTEGGKLDFHALRHTFITNVANSGASVKTIQDLARHSTPTLTIGRYAHTTDTERAAAINALPELMPLDESAAATGTDDETGDSSWPTYCPKLPVSLSPATTPTERNGTTPVGTQSVVKPPHIAENKGFTPKPPAGLEPATCGLRNRCKVNVTAVTTTTYAIRANPAQRWAQRAQENGPVDDDLAAVINVWPGLPDAVKVGILAMVRAAQPQV